MTTPAMPLMPFSVPFAPTLGTNSLFTSAEFVNHSDSYNTQCIKLLAGVSQVRVTWDGAEPIRYRIDRAGTSSSWVEIIASSAVQSPRSSKIIEVALSEPGYFWIQTSQPASAASIDAKARAGVTVIPMAGPEGRI